MNKATKNLSIGMAVLIVCTIILFALTLKKPFLNIEDVGMTWLHSDNITKIVVDPGAGEQYVVNVTSSKQIAEVVGIFTDLVMQREMKVVLDGYFAIHFYVGDTAHTLSLKNFSFIYKSQYRTNKNLRLEVCQLLDIRV